MLGVVACLGEGRFFSGVVFVSEEVVVVWVIVDEGLYVVFFIEEGTI